MFDALEIGQDGDTSSHLIGEKYGLSHPRGGGRSGVSAWSEKIACWLAALIPFSLYIL